MTPLGSFVIPFASLVSSVDELAAAGVWWGNRFFGRLGCDSETDNTCSSQFVVTSSISWFCDTDKSIAALSDSSELASRRELPAFDSKVANSSPKNLIRASVKKNKMASRRRVVSDSESESDEPVGPSVPSDDVLEKALRDTVAKIYKSGNMEELTVKRVRMAAEKVLGVEEGFFKGSSIWKSKSDQIIKDEVVQDKRAQEPKSDEELEEPAPPAKKASSAKRTKPDKAETSRKRRKTNTPEHEDQSEVSAPLDDESEEEVKKPAKKQPKSTAGKSSKPKPRKEQMSDDSGDVEPKKDDVAPSEAEESKNDRGEDSESEMSVVLDEEPKPTRKRQKSAGSEASTQKGKKKTITAKAKDADLDPDQKKIKELQDLLVKCGIRKLWWRLLAPYETSKEKIGHLEGMLREAGMTGPFKGKEAERKALKIRERRELQADVASCQEEVKLYGKDGADEESDSGRPGRRLNRGRKHLAFLEDDGEETD
ncbi:unnamed protein product [Aspergillus oryzae]|nr:unnamed protein product [Aspergillus oryzae]GMF87197.1 unnamed protein product [Aspergillus oryzae]